MIKLKVSKVEDYIEFLFGDTIILVNCINKNFFIRTKDGTICQIEQGFKRWKANITNIIYYCYDSCRDLTQEEFTLLKEALNNGS